MTDLILFPVASQMSNMSNQNKFMKLLARDHGRKVKASKVFDSLELSRFFLHDGMMKKHFFCRVLLGSKVQEAHGHYLKIRLNSF